jgi:manganese-dependent inorganic pyrophosphatase
MYRSPTCTAYDRAAAEQLAEIAEINIEEYAKEMFAAGSNLRNKATDEIFYQDFKRFTVGDINFGVGQITSMNEEELVALKTRILPFMAQVDAGVDAIFFMLTDILNESTEMLFYGKRAKQILEEAYLLSAENFQDEGSCTLRKIVSRKKQVIPAIVGSLQQ